MEGKQRLTQVQGAAAVGLYQFVPFWSGCLSFSFHLSAVMKGNGGGALPSSQLARRQRGYFVLSYSN